MKKYLAIIFILAITWSGCKKNYLDLNANPNLPITAAPNLLLSGALKITADILNGNTKTTVSGTTATTDANYTMYACYMGYLSWSTSYQPNVDLLQYTFTNANYDVWTKLYINVSNYNELAKATKEPYYLAISKIMTAFDYQQLVDNYNNVPYTEALSGTGNLTPKYDKGSDIYDDLMKQLDAAIVLIQKAPANAVNPGPADIMYKGVMTNWIQFANTLKLRLAIRQSNLGAKQSALKTAVAATTGLGYINASNPAVVNPGYSSSDYNGGQQSPLYGAYGYNSTGSAQDYNARYQANQYGANFYLNNADPRAKQVYAANASGVIIATFLGQTTTTPAGLTPSKLGPGAIKGATMDAVIVSGAEALFLQAEAASIGLISGSAQSFYNDGITASFVDDLVPNAVSAAAAYYAQPAIAFPVGGSPAQQQKAIIVQKWAALNPYGSFEAFNEYRRTGYPDNIPLSVYPGANAPNQITRILYPAVEYRTNPGVVGAEGNIDKFTSKIFWAK
ncbi:SusD/RagB family nutrient-binding outer membrane lipoprotein [Pedobacter sp. PAMC26386]|nr:SusD/RagB family nutrient-binding outer membrane lipoprotein [Pedobacter sp. PAMC26386]